MQPAGGIALSTITGTISPERLAVNDQLTKAYHQSDIEILW
jgi:hypothetical protein